VRQITHRRKEGREGKEQGAGRRGGRERILDRRKESLLFNRSIS